MNVRIFSQFILFLGAAILVVSMGLAKKAGEDEAFARTQFEDLITQAMGEYERTSDRVDYIGTKSGYYRTISEYQAKQQHSMYGAAAGALVLLLGIGLFVASRPNLVGKTDLS